MYICAPLIQAKEFMHFISLSHERTNMQKNNKKRQKSRESKKLGTFFGEHEDTKNEIKEIFHPCLMMFYVSHCFCELVVSEEV